MSEEKEYSQKLFLLCSETIFCIACFYVFVVSFFPTIANPAVAIKGLLGLFSVFVCAVLIYLIHQHFIIFLNNRALLFVMLILGGVFIFFQLLCLIVFEVEPSWDFGVVYRTAQSLALGKPLEENFYFEYFPYNVNLTIVLSAIMRVTKSIHTSAYLLNIVAIDISIIAGGIYCWFIFSPLVAFYYSLISLLTTPLYFYVPIVYSDTIAMPFPIFTLAIIAFADRKLSGWMKNLAYICSGICSAIGFLIKATTGVVIVAWILTRGFALVEALIKLLKRKELGDIYKYSTPLVLTTFAFILISMFGSSFLHKHFWPETLVSEKQIPMLHMVQMGLSKHVSEGGGSWGWGGFNDDDYARMANLNNRKERLVSIKETIKQRLNDFGLLGYLRFLTKKLEWTWADGTFYAPEKLRRKPLVTSSLHKFILYTPEQTNKFYLAFSQIIHAFKLLIIVFSVLVFIFGKEEDKKYHFGLMISSMLFILLFFLLWETRSRYLVSMIPIINIVVAVGIFEAIYLINNLKNKYTQKTGLS